MSRPAPPGTPPVGLTRRFWLLSALRWLPTGMVIPVSVLLPVARGLPLSQVGAAMAAQGVVVMLLELPTGSLTDTWGRRRVLLVSAGVALVAYLVVPLATNLAGFAAAWALMGVFRALDSGPLEAWYVDAARAAGADQARVARGLSSAGAATGVAIAVGALAGGALVALAPSGGPDALALPFRVAAVVVGGQMVAAAVLMREPRRSAQAPVAGWTEVLRAGLGMVARRGALRRLFAVQALVGVGMMAFEVYMPVRLDEFAGQVSGAGAAMGPITAAAWGAGAIGAGLTALAARRVVARALAVTLFAVQALAVVGMALAGGPAALIAAFLVTYLVHIGAGATFGALMHDEVDDAHRATALSVMSLAMQGAGAAASIGFGLLAQGQGAPAALGAGALALLVGAAVLSRGRLGRRAAAPRLAAGDSRTAPDPGESGHLPGSPVERMPTGGAGG